MTYLKHNYPIFLIWEIRKNLGQVLAVSKRISQLPLFLSQIEQVQVSDMGKGCLTLYTHYSHRHIVIWVRIILT